MSFSSDVAAHNPVEQLIGYLMVEIISIYWFSFLDILINPFALQIMDKVFVKAWGGGLIFVYPVTVVSR